MQAELFQMLLWHVCVCALAILIYKNIHENSCLTLMIHWGLRGPKDSGSAGTHVKLGQCQLVHEVRQLKNQQQLFIQSIQTIAHLEQVKNNTQQDVHIGQ